MFGVRFVAHAVRPYSFLFQKWGASVCRRAQRGEISQRSWDLSLRSRRHPFVGEVLRCASCFAWLRNKMTSSHG